VSALPPLPQGSEPWVEHGTAPDKPWMGHAGLPTDETATVPYRPDHPVDVDQRPYRAFAAIRGDNSR
jgi:hypothetical protein